jgi:hypothetical protein
MDKDKQEIINDLKAEWADLISQLTSPYSSIGDWKLNKQEEAKLLGHELPYTEAQMQEYGRKRAAARDRINELEKEIEELEK